MNILLSLLSKTLASHELYQLWNDKYGYCSSRPFFKVDQQDKLVYLSSKTLSFGNSTNEFEPAREKVVYVCCPGICD